MEYMNNIISHLKSYTYFGNTLFNYIVAVVIFAAIVFAITVFIRYVVKRINIDRISNVFLATVIETFRRRLVYISYALAIYGALSYLKTPDAIASIIDKAVVVYVSVIVILAITDILKNINNGEYKVPAGIITLFKALVWIIGLLFIFSNLGYNVSTFITGLGIGGIAVALAAQNILGDLFNYFVILFDKPFVKGDTIQFGNNTGKIEYVGIKSTKVRSSNGELLSVSNTDLTKTTIHNYELASKRRNISIIGVEYETSVEKVHQIPALLEQAVKSVKEAEFSRVHFSSFNTSSLDFELVYYILTNDYTEYANGVQAVNYAILDIFAKEGINFAYPAQRMIKQ